MIGNSDLYLVNINGKIDTLEIKSEVKRFFIIKNLSRKEKRKKLDQLKDTGFDIKGIDSIIFDP